MESDLFCTSSVYLMQNWRFSDYLISCLYFYFIDYYFVYIEGNLMTQVILSLEIYYPVSVMIFSVLKYIPLLTCIHIFYEIMCVTEDNLCD